MYMWCYGSLALAAYEHCLKVVQEREHKPGSISEYDLFVKVCCCCFSKNMFNVQVSISFTL